MPVITKLIDEKDNLCSYCSYCIADCPGKPEFSEIPTADNVISCDTFNGDFNPDIMTRREVVYGRTRF